MYIIHVASKALFTEEIKTGFYGANSIQRCGFVHCSDIDTYYLVAPNFKDDQDQKVILVIDTERLNSKVKWEDGGGLDFPHIYGLITQEAIVDVLDHLWSPEKEWIPNEELKKYASNGFRREWNEP